MFPNNVCIFASVLIVAVVVGIYIQKAFVDTEGEDFSQFTTLIIGILSARENSALRDIIRKTWLSSFASSQRDKRAKNSVHVKSQFIIGEQYCHVPPAYRTDKYDCKKWNLNISEVEEDFFTLMEVNGHKCPPHEFSVFHQGFSFQVNHRIIIKALGVLSKLLPENYNVSVALVDSRTKEVIVQTSLTSSQAGVLSDGFLYRPVENYVLPKDYEGTVLVEGYLLHSGCSSVRWNDNGGVLSFTRIFRNPNDFETIEFSKESCVASSIRFSVLDTMDLTEIASEESTAFSDWHNSQHLITAALQKEADEWEDILFVDVVDVYRNIPRKLLHFYVWLSSHEVFSYVLKTDDDCIVDVSTILRELSENSQFSSTSMWWWSRFRHQWPVNYFGKWADFDYKSPVYPSFPCGAGYILSKEIVQWLAKNAPYLHTYQGEDVSMGIWLAAVNPVYIEDYRWQCDFFCNVSSFNRAQLTADDMFDVWSNYTKCGDLCICNSSEET